ncbi:MAG TPA: AMP-binding protein [Terriglobales bacterium]|nr:AMP-binding protein [Terriglobales bacterium]
MIRDRFLADPEGIFVHDVILSACRRFPSKTAIVDTSCLEAPLRITYAQYADLITRLARGFVAAGISPGDVVGIFLANSWEFVAAYHASTLAGATPTMLNPSYREREVRYQLENSGARILISDGSLVRGMNLGGLPALQAVYTTRTDGCIGDLPFNHLLKPQTAPLPKHDRHPREVIAALPYSSGTTGLPKGVMLSHHNLVSNCYQTYGPGASPSNEDQRVLVYLPLYHIYGLNVLMNPYLMIGATVVLMPRFIPETALQLWVDERITTSPSVPPVLNAYCQLAEKGLFPQNHQVTWIKSGAAPLAPELARRFTELTGIKIRHGYGMTEASPVTHLGYTDPPEWYRPEWIGQPLYATECRVVAFDGDHERDAAVNEPGELVMRGPQFMLGYWNNPQATADVMRDGWYWSGDVVIRDDQGFYRVVDRRKEMIKYKGFPVAPAEVESVLMEHPAVRDCGVVGRPDAEAGEVPCAFIVLRDDVLESNRTRDEIVAFVAERVAHYKVPHDIRFVQAIPRNPSGKILRRELRAAS